MAHIYPGATWRPMPGQEKRAARRKGRGAIFHVAVFIGPSIYGINLGTGNDAHLYVRKDGSVEQNVDLDRVAFAAVDANPTMVMVETEGGKGTSAQVNAEPWTPQQVETLAQIAAYLHLTEGAPLRVMTDSLPSSSGIAVHRWGITPWRVSGGEKWSGANGKECPGNAKIAQVPAIVARAQQISAGGAAAGQFVTTTEEDFMATMSEAEKAKLMDFVDRAPIYIWNDQNGNPLIMERNGGKPRTARDVQGDIYVHTVALQQQIAGLTAAVNTLAAGAAGEGTTAEELRAVIREEMANAVDVQVTVNGAKAV